MNNKVLSVLSFVPIVNVVVAFYCAIMGFVRHKILKNFLGCALFATIISAFAIPRIIVTIVCSYFNLPIIDDIVTYTTLYISVSLGTFIWVKMLKLDNKKG